MDIWKGLPRVYEEYILWLLLWPFTHCGTKYICSCLHTMLCIKSTTQWVSTCIHIHLLAYMYMIVYTYAIAVYKDKWTSPYEFLPYWQSPVHINWGRVLLCGEAIVWCGLPSDEECDVGASPNTLLWKSLVSWSFYYTTRRGQELSTVQKSTFHKLSWWILSLQGWWTASVLSSQKERVWMDGGVVHHELP